MAKLVYVSNNVILPNGAQNPFFLQEKKWLLDRFGTFCIVSPKGLYQCKNEEAPDLYKSLTKLKKMLGFIKGLFCGEVYKELLHMIRDGKFTVKNALKLFWFSVNAATMELLLDDHIKTAGAENTVVYSYWLSYDAAAVAQIKKKYPQIYTIARAHSYELQIERNSCNPYLMKRLICRNLDKIAFIAKDSENRFCSYYKEPLPNGCIAYLGSDEYGTGYVSRGMKDILTVVTCSSIVPVKWLERMIDALNRWQGSPLHWIHIGDGANGEQIRCLAKEKLSKNPCVTYEFVGYMDNRQVHEFLRREDLDVFVNCSKAEGVPVSIMEAMSVGLPVIAPRMFGIPELVRDGCGLLFEQNDGYENLLNTLKIFAEKSKDEREKMGISAYNQWENAFCLQKNLQELFSTVK